MTDKQAQRTEREEVVIRVFLSHSGRDAQRAIALSAELKQELHHLSGLTTNGIEVFNTSEPEYRFTELQHRLRAGDLWEQVVREYDSELKTYLSNALQTSSAYVLLVTPASLAAQSQWIELEIEMAFARAKAGTRFFYPCVDGGLTLAALPPKANEFQGIELVEGRGKRRAASVRAMADALISGMRR